MSQTIDLRKKELPKIIPPTPPSPEPEPEVKVQLELPAQAETISWHAMLHRVPLKEVAWYIAGILFIAATVVAYFRQDFLFSVILALVGIVLILRAHSTANPSHIHLDRTGISIDGQKYLYREVGSFWVDYQPPHTKELSLQFKKVHHASIRIPLENTNPLEVRAHMIQFIPEKEHERSTLDYVIRLLNL